MAGLVEGKWVASLPAAEEMKGGHFVRAESVFRNAVSSDPKAEFPAEAGRYELWIAWGCPWAGRTLAVRALKGLQDLIKVHAAIDDLGDEGWTFGESPDGPMPEGYALHRLYSRAAPRYTGKVSVPVLWDAKSERIVNNESSDIIRMLGTAFDELTDNRLDLYPVSLRDEIDRWNAIIYPNVNNGVYRSGFAATQAAYDEAVTTLFETLDLIDDHLATNRYLAGEYCTEADWRLFVTLVRFDIGYFGAFKCNLRRIDDYRQLPGYLRELYQWPGIAETVRLQQIKSNYWSLKNLGTNGIIPIGPIVDLTTPHDRAQLPGHGIWTPTA